MEDDKRKLDINVYDADFTTSSSDTNKVMRDTASATHETMVNPIHTSDEMPVDKIHATDEMTSTASSSTASAGSNQATVDITQSSDSGKIAEDGFVSTHAIEDENLSDELPSDELLYEEFSFKNHSTDPHSSDKYKKSKREPKYVKRSVFAIFLVAGIILSSVLGSLVSIIVLNANGYLSKGRKPSASLSHLDVSKATGSKLTVSEIVAKNENSVVEITVAGTKQGGWGQTEISQGSGSGVIVNKNGYIVTNHHVLEGANKVQVRLHNGDVYEATIVGGDSDNDLAVIKIDAKNLTPVTIGKSSDVAVGDLAVAIGNPLGKLGGTATSGIISALDRRLTIGDRTMNLLQTDAAINPGNSGGGLFDGAGNLIGIVDAKSAGSGIEGLAFAIPIDSIADSINDLIEHGKVRTKPSIGILIQDVSDENASFYNVNKPGVYIAEVTGENAKKAGFQEGDRVISVNGKKIESSRDLISRVRSYKVGDTVTVVVSRSDQEISIKTVLGSSTTTE